MFVNVWCMESTHEVLTLNQRGSQTKFWGE